MTDDWIPLSEATMQLIEARGMVHSAVDREIHRVLASVAEKGTADRLSLQWVRKSWLKGLQPISEVLYGVSSLREAVEESGQQVPLRMQGWKALQDLKHLMAAAGPNLPLYARIVEKWATPSAVGHAFYWSGGAIGHMGPLCKSPHPGTEEGYLPTKYTTCEACKAQIVENALTS